MTRLRLIADDLTGALDTAAQFVGRAGPVPVLWRMPATPPPSAAMDIGTREQNATWAAAVATETAALLQPASGAVAFKKIDSLLRGHSGLELAHCFRALPSLSHCIIAPAFPFQRRVTRGGRQYANTGDAWQIVGEDLAATLAAEGLAVRQARPGDPVPPGISLWDAETDADLHRIVAGATGLSGVLWCGSSGLAGAIAGPHPPRTEPLARPILGLFGSDHPVTLRQLDAAGQHRLVLPDGGTANARLLTRRLTAFGAALVGFALSPGLTRPDAARQITREMTALLDHVAPPRTLVVAGGETLRALSVERARIAVAALNPHAGEGGLFGRQDIDVSAPLIARCVRDGMDVVGPVPGDTVFVKLRAGQCDAVVAMYHDQGHIPVKLLWQIAGGPKRPEA